jgi:hypothetical protein
MFCWVTVSPKDPSYGETIAKHERLRRHKEMQTSRERGNRPMNVYELISTIKQSPQRLANVYTTFVQQAEAMEA